MKQILIATVLVAQIRGDPKRLSGSEPLRMCLVISFASNRPIATETQIDSVVTVDVNWTGVEETFAIP